MQRSTPYPPRVPQHHRSAAWDAIRRLDADGAELTVRAVWRASGIPGLGDTHAALRHLRARGLVTWDDGSAGTLRLAVRPVVFVRVVPIVAT